VTGTVLQNRIPVDVRFQKTLDEYKRMKRGDSVKGKVLFKKKDWTQAAAGLVCWKDRQIALCCLSNNTNNFEMDRLGEGGILDFTRPVLIARYNQFMGGVGLADMKRLHCSSTIMVGQNRSWLKLCF